MMSSLGARRGEAGRRGVKMWGRGQSVAREGDLATHVAVETDSMMLTVVAPPAASTWFVSLLSSYSRAGAGTGGSVQVS